MKINSSRLNTRTFQKQRIQEEQAAPSDSVSFSDNRGLRVVDTVSGGLIAGVTGLAAGSQISPTLGLVAGGLGAAVGFGTGTSGLLAGGLGAAVCAGAGAGALGPIGAGFGGFLGFFAGVEAGKKFIKDFK